MDRGDAIYILFWSLAISVALFVMGYGNDAAMFFALALLGAAFADRMENTAYAAGALLAALGFAAYFGKSLAFTGPRFVAVILFAFLPFLLLEVRRLLRKR